MQPLFLRREGRVKLVEMSWDHLLTRIAESARAGKTLKALPRKTIGGGRASATVGEHLRYLVKILQIATPYKSLAYIPSGRRPDLLLSLKKIRLKKKELVKKLGVKGYYLPALMYGLACNYLVAVEDRKGVFVARSPLGDFIVEKCGLASDRVDVKTLLTYFFGCLLAPSRTSVMYLVMNDLRSRDTEAIARVLKSHLLAKPLESRYWRLYLTMSIEVNETWYLGKYERLGLKVREEYVTPSHVAYALACMADRVLDFDTYRKLMVYITQRKWGLVAEEGFKHLFEGVIASEDEVRELVGTNRVLSIVGDLIERLRDNYEWLDSELSRLAS